MIHIRSDLIINPWRPSTDKYHLRLSFYFVDLDFWASTGCWSTSWAVRCLPQKDLSKVNGQDLTYYLTFITNSSGFLTAQGRCFWGSSSRCGESGKKLTYTGGLNRPWCRRNWWFCRFGSLLCMAFVRLSGKWGRKMTSLTCLWTSHGLWRRLFRSSECALVFDCLAFLLRAHSRWSESCREQVHLF